MRHQTKTAEYVKGWRCDWLEDAPLPHPDWVKSPRKGYGLRGVTFSPLFPHMVTPGMSSASYSQLVFLSLSRSGSKSRNNKCLVEIQCAVFHCVYILLSVQSNYHLHYHSQTHKDNKQTTLTATTNASITTSTPPNKQNTTLQLLKNAAHRRHRHLLRHSAASHGCCLARCQA